MANKFLNAVFNLPINSLFTYYIPEHLQDKIKPGMRVLAPFGRRNITGIVLELPNEKTILKRTKGFKSIIKFLDEEPLLTNEMIDFCRWVAKYYVCPIGEVFFSAIPKGKPRLEKFLIFEHLDEFKEFANSILENFFKENKIRSENHINLLKELIRQNIKEVRLSELMKKEDITAGAVSSLVKKGLLRTEMRRVIRRIEDEFGEKENTVNLNTEQQNIFTELTRAVKAAEFEPFLLFGITGSGKTNVYMETINVVLKENKTAIVLVPEISLTPQLIHRFKNFFGDIIGVIHSGLSAGEKFDVYYRIRTGEVKIVIGARSAIFAPLENLGIIIVDEEHDHSYKQSEKNPKYNARDCALVRGKMNNAVVVLGSATPSLESFYNARTGKYKLLELPYRAKKTKQPEVEIVNMLEEMKFAGKYGKFKSPDKKFLSSKLIAYMDYALRNKQNIILLQNRRGYSAYLECQNCGNVKMCINCDITMIYHKTTELLRCHYCGFSESLPEKCEKCGSSELELKGTGTEKVEEEIERLFSEAKIKRMDSDTVRRKGTHRKILKSFHKGEFDILVGTQMISKGLDFPNVYLVGVISADIGLLNPDFRASERTFQMLMQVAGRSGRISDYGKAVIQTMHPDNYIFEYIIKHDYVSFYEKEISFRENFNYPPFSRITLIEVKGKDAKRVKTIAVKIYLFIKNLIPDSPKETAHIKIFKPAPALVYKIKNKYREHIIIKIPKGDLHISTETILSSLQKYMNELNLKTTEQVGIDVDPISFS